MDSEPLHEHLAFALAMVSMMIEAHGVRPDEWDGRPFVRMDGSDEESLKIWAFENDPRGLLAAIASVCDRTLAEHRARLEEASAA